MTPTLSILICSLNKRAGMLSSLLGKLSEQIEALKAWDQVEVLVEMDNGEKPTGTKRNMLYQMAKGKYSLSCDDDDSPADFYVEELLKAAESDADCFSMGGIMTNNGGNEKKWYISKNYPYIASRNDLGEEIYLRFPNHITSIRSSIAKQFQFPDAYQSEDYAWALAIHQSGLIKTEYLIERFPMYHYQYLTVKK